VLVVGVSVLVVFGGCDVVIGGPTVVKGKSVDGMFEEVGVSMVVVIMGKGVLGGSVSGLV